MNMTETLECAYLPCQCTVTAPAMTGEGYCSESCQDADAGGEESEMCDCGHPQCDVTP